MGKYQKVQNYPWTKASEFDPVPGDTMALEEFLTEVMGYILILKVWGKDR